MSRHSGRAVGLPRFSRRQTYARNDSVASDCATARLAQNRATVPPLVVIMRTTFCGAIGDFHAPARKMVGPGGSLARALNVAIRHDACRSSLAGFEETPRTGSRRLSNLASGLRRVNLRDARSRSRAARGKSAIEADRDLVRGKFASYPGAHRAGAESTTLCSSRRISETAARVTSTGSPLERSGR